MGKAEKVFMIVWYTLIFLGLIVGYFTKEISTDTFYMGLIGCGIWSTLMNVGNKE